MHFKYLVNQVLPDLVRQSGAGVGKKMMVWIVGCSTGQEPYTLSMVLHEFALRVPIFSYEILATDESSAVLEKANAAIYDEKKIGQVPHDLRKKYFLKGKDSKAGLVRIIPDLRQTVKFRCLNISQEEFGLREKMDIIFCRSVVLNAKILNRFCKHLNAGGYIFIGQADFINDFNSPLKKMAPAVYKKTP